MKRDQEHRINRAGLVAVEAAFLLPVLFIVFLGIIDAARYQWAHGVVRDAAYEGARVAILNEATQTHIESTIVAELQSGGVDSEQRAITIGERVPSEPVNVTVSVPFSFYIIDSIVDSLSENFHVSASVSMTHER